MICPPPCTGATPYMLWPDVSQLGSLIFGVLAAHTTWQVIRANRPKGAVEAKVTTGRPFVHRLRSYFKLGGAGDRHKRTEEAKIQMSRRAKETRKTSNPTPVVPKGEKLTTLRTAVTIPR